MSAPPRRVFACRTLNTEYGKEDFMFETLKTLPRTAFALQSTSSTLSRSCLDARSRWLSFFTPVVALMLAALSLFAAAPAAADVLVSNTGQTGGAASSVQSTAYAQGFTTGANGTGYTLENIDIKAFIGGSAALTAQERATIEVELWSSSSGKPGAKLADLTNPSSIPVGAGTYSFSAPAGTTLLANTEYHVVVYTASTTFQSFSVFQNASDAEDSGAATGWSIANNGHFTTNNAAAPTASSTWATNSNNTSLEIRVDGTAQAQVNGDIANPRNFAVMPGEGALTATWMLPQGLDTDAYSYRYYIRWRVKSPQGNWLPSTTLRGSPVRSYEFGGGGPYSTTELVIGADTCTDCQALGNGTEYEVELSLLNLTTNSRSSWVRASGTPFGPKTWSFSPDTYIEEPGTFATLVIELSEAAPHGGLEFALSPIFSSTGLNAANRCVGARGAEKAVSSDVGSGAPTSLTVRAGQTKGRVRFPVADNGDDLVGATECFAVRATAPSGWALASGGDDTSQITIRANGLARFGAARPYFDSLSDYTVTVSEDAGTVRVPLTASWLPVSDTTVEIEVVSSGADAGTTMEGSDYTIATKSVTFGPSDTSRTQYVDVVIADDTDQEAAETIVLRLKQGNPTYTRQVSLPGRLATLTIQDNDSPETMSSSPLTALSISVGDNTYPLSPSYDPATRNYTVNLPRGSASTLKVNATFNSQYGGVSTGWAARPDQTPFGLATIVSGPGGSGETLPVSGSASISMSGTSYSQTTPYINVRVAQGAPNPDILYSIRVSFSLLAAPTALNVTQGDGQLNMFWTAPSGTLTGYDVQYTSAPMSGDGAVTNAAAVQAGASPSAANGWVAVDRGTLTDPPVAAQVIAGLTNGQLYRVRVRAKNAAGDSRMRKRRGLRCALRMLPVSHRFMHRYVPCEACKCHTAFSSRKA